VKWFNITKDFVLIEENNSKELSKELLVQRSSIKAKGNKMLTKAKEKVKAGQAKI
jgi:cold shock CspA family protein